MFGQLMTLGSWIKEGEASQEARKNLKGVITGLSIGTVVGPVAGAVVGWVRGERLDKPSDLFTHPIESLKKIFGPAPKHTAMHAHAETAAPSQHTVHAPQHDGTVAPAEPAIQR